MWDRNRKGSRAHIGEAQSSREEGVGTDAKERGSLVSKSPSHSWTSAGLAQGMGWRGERGTIYGVQRKVMCLLIMVGSRILESPSLGPALFCVGFSYFFLSFFIYLFMAALGLCHCRRAFSTCGEWGQLCSCGIREFLSAIVSLVAEHRLQACGLQSLQRLGSVVVAHRV